MVRTKPKKMKKISAQYLCLWRLQFLAHTVDWSSFSFVFYWHNYHKYCWKVKIALNFFRQLISVSPHRLSLLTHFTQSCFADVFRIFFSQRNISFIFRVHLNATWQPRGGGHGCLNISVSKYHKGKGVGQQKCNVTFISKSQS